MWLFGYGSLIYRPAFTFVERRPAWIRGWERRFWQGSPDHRGTPEAPGRVVTLVPAPDAWCGGVAYRLSEHEAEQVLAQVDQREQAGFERIVVDLAPAPHAAAFASGVVYVAGPDNPHFLGPLPIDELAAHVAESAGPSGPNIEYVLHLAEALRALGAADPHVEELAAHLAHHASEPKRKMDIP